MESKMETEIVVLPSLKNAQPREIADRIIEILDAKKARSIKLLSVADQTIVADYFIICEGTSNTNIKALAGELEMKMTEQELPPIHMEGYPEGTWVVLDFASCLVHIFNRDTRDFYKLEKLWENGTEIPRTETPDGKAE